MNKITLGISICALAISLIVVGLSVHQLILNDTTHSVSYVEIKEDILPAGSQSCFSEIINGTHEHNRMICGTTLEPKVIDSTSTTLTTNMIVHECIYYDDRHDYKQFTEWHTDPCPNIWKWN